MLLAIARRCARLCFRGLSGSGTRSAIGTNSSLPCRPAALLGREVRALRFFAFSGRIFGDRAIGGSAVMSARAGLSAAILSHAPICKATELNRRLSEPIKCRKKLGVICDRAKNAPTLRPLGSGLRATCILKVAPPRAEAIISPAGCRSARCQPIGLRGVGGSPIHRRRILP